LKYLKLILSVLGIFLIFQFNLYSSQRVVLLSPAVGDIFIKLGLKDVVVGVTKHMKGFPKAKKVGSHLHPNIEIIKSLHPDYLIISSYRFFPKKFSRLIDAKIIVYNPKTLDGILKSIEKIGIVFHKEKESRDLCKKLKKMLKKIKKLKKKPKVIYEVMENPYIVAGKKSIINDIIEKAGGINVINVDKSHVKFSEILVRFLNPEFYIYQIGPMNKNPVYPLKRKVFKGCKFHVIKVKEEKFARANTQSFENVLYLNKIFSLYTK